MCDVCRQCARILDHGLDGAIPEHDDAEYFGEWRAYGVHDVDGDRIDGVGDREEQNGIRVGRYAIVDWSSSAHVEI